MIIDCNNFYNFLKKSGVSSLYHANTVPTSINFLTKGGLISRQKIENLQLIQTPQYSDNLDKIFGIYDDVFLDSFDLHSHFNRQNHYGPVLFEFGLDAFLDANFKISVTKKNPTKWQAQEDINARYFSSYSDLQENWEKYRPEGRMITIRKPTAPVLFDHLKAITVDDLIVDGKNYGEHAISTLARFCGKIASSVKLRTHHYHCYCQQNYSMEISRERLDLIFGINI